MVNSVLLIAAISYIICHWFGILKTYQFHRFLYVHLSTASWMEIKWAIGDQGGSQDHYFLADWCVIWLLSYYDAWNNTMGIVFHLLLNAFGYPFGPSLLSKHHSNWLVTYILAVFVFKATGSEYDQLVWIQANLLRSLWEIRVQTDYFVLHMESL